MKSRIGLAVFAASAIFAGLTTGSANAASCIGTCGTLGADGVVTTSPDGGNYDYISTEFGVGGAGQIASVGGTNGSSFSTSAFTAAAGDLLKFFFNYVTSDGAEFADYSWAELTTSTFDHVAWIFTARTQPVGNTSPGFGLPDNDSTLTPATTAIIPGAPSWSPLGGSSGACWDIGCGYTGWIQSEYTIASAGSYILTFGVSNFIDGDFQSGLAIDGATIGGTPIPGAVPIPAALPLFASAIAGLGLLRLRRRRMA